jgi:hypothetical protein
MPHPAIQLDTFPDLDPATFLRQLIDLQNTTAPRMARAMGYYQNPRCDLSALVPGPSAAPLSVRPYRQFQEIGLPARITGFRCAIDGATTPIGPIDLQRKEVVIENDIAWRLDTLVDFVASSPPIIRSLAPSAARRTAIDAIISALFSPNLMLPFLQQVTLLGSIHGSAFVMLQPPEELLAALPPAAPHASQNAAPITIGAPDPAASPSAPAPLPPSDPVNAPTDTPPPPANPGVPLPRLQVVDASRVLPIFSATPQGASSIQSLAYVAILHSPAAAPDAPSTLARLTRWIFGSGDPSAPLPPFDLFSPTRWTRFINGQPVAAGPNPFGFIPIASFLNHAALLTTAQTAGNVAYPDRATFGASDVDPLIPLQDELNTRLSDRANRITLQSFRMYLAKGIEDFIKRPVGPGQMWATDNLDATIESFGGDESTPSETAHISDLRDALDKTSGVSPVAAGIIEGKIGNLTSAVALKVTLIATLSRTNRKRAALTQMIQTIVTQTLAMLQTANLFATTDADRLIDITWPSPIPENDTDRLTEAQMKLAIGVDKKTVLAELGY